MLVGKVGSRKGKEGEQPNSRASQESVCQVTKKNRKRSLSRILESELRGERRRREGVGNKVSGWSDLEWSSEIACDPKTLHRRSCRVHLHRPPLLLRPRVGYYSPRQSTISSSLRPSSRNRAPVSLPDPSPLSQSLSLAILAVEPQSKSVRSLSLKPQSPSIP